MDLLITDMLKLMLIVVDGTTGGRRKAYCHSATPLASARTKVSTTVVLIILLLAHASISTDATELECEDASDWLYIKSAAKTAMALRCVLCASALHVCVCTLVLGT